VTSHIGDRELKFQESATKTVISRDMISRLDQNRSLWRTRVRRSRGVEVQRIGVSEDGKHLPLGIAKRDIPTEGSCGPQSGLVEDRWYRIRNQKKGSPKSFDIRIRDPANPEIPTEATEGGRVKSTRVSEHRHIGIRRSEFQFVDIASSDFPMGRTLIERGRK
jgi:hypothetical protein